MSVLTIRTTVLVLYMTFVGSVPGCTRYDETYCATHPENPACPDAGPRFCTTSGDCEAPTAVCDVNDSKTCVQCVDPGDTSACVGSAPVCGHDNVCQPCGAHVQCASNACQPDGSCAEEANVAYVQMGGTGTACTRATPCGTLDIAVNMTTKAVVKIAAGLVKDIKKTVIDGKRVTILADAGAQLDRDLDGPILEVTSNGAEVQICDLEITGATRAGDAAIVLTPNGGVPKLTLTRVLVSGNQGSGILASGGSLTVAQSTLFANRGGGISVGGAGALINITNSFIVRNGNSTSTFGGIDLRNVLIDSSRLAFNTIIDNESGGGAASAGGVFCDETGFVANSNIVFRNRGGSTGDIQTIGNCTYGNSLNTPGASGVDNSLGFVSPNAAPFDYHLSPTSPTTIVDAAGACTGVDVDGDARPSGPACDLGADEKKP